MLNDTIANTKPASHHDGTWPYVTAAAATPATSAASPNMARIVLDVVDFDGRWRTRGPTAPSTPRFDGDVGIDLIDRGAGTEPPNRFEISGP